MKVVSPVVRTHQTIFFGFWTLGAKKSHLAGSQSVPLQAMVAFKSSSYDSLCSIKIKRLAAPFHFLDFVALIMGILCSSPKLPHMQLVNLSLTMWWPRNVIAGSQFTSDPVVAPKSFQECGGQKSCLAGSQYTTDHMVSLKITLWAASAPPTTCWGPCNPLVSTKV